MADDATTRLQRCLERLRAGDEGARQELLSGACERLRRLTGSMLRDYRRLKRWEQTDDVLQGALLRLYRALGPVTPQTPREFFRLAALQIRRELIDLARHHYGPQGRGAHHASNSPAADASTASSAPYEAAGVSHEPGRLAAWSEFHEQVELLPEEEREVFDLLFYQGLSQAEAAALLGVTDRTIKRRWQGARLKLHAALGGALPGI